MEQQRFSLVVDFETMDRGLNSKVSIGPAWPVVINNPESNMFKVIGVSLLEITDGVLGEPRYIDLTQGSGNVKYLSQIISEAETIIMHNAQYDLGCLLTLGIDIKPLRVLDTKILAKLYDNNLMSYSLDPLSERYLKDKKLKSSLSDVVRKHHFLGEKKETLKTFDRLATAWAYENMDVIQLADFEAMAAYANQDTVLTGRLYKLFMSKLDPIIAEKFCKLQKICVEIRAKGVRIDMKALRHAVSIIKPRVEELHKEVREELKIPVGHEFNLDSPTQLGEVLVKLGHKLPVTVTGKPQTDKDALAELAKTSDTGKKILKYREARKILNDFFIKIEDMQQWTCPEAYQGGDFGRIYPELNVLAAMTGRFSSCNPNIQQIPKRSEEWTELVRAIYVPDEGLEWHSLDWSNQEGRLQIHYAAIIGAPKIQELVDAFNHNPDLDMHQKVADICGIKRDEAKAINLGLSYGMGEGKLCHQLGLPTKSEWIIRGRKKVNVEVAGEEAARILGKYRTLMPYLDKLNEKCTAQIKARGYIRTIGGRHVRREMENGVGKFDYKAMNKLIQGSAADQCMEVMIRCYDEGIDVKFVVHDEFNIQGSLEDALRVKEIMETALDLKIPMVAELKSGESWGTLKKIKNNLDIKE